MDLGEHALSYPSRAASIPHRAEGKAALIEQLPAGIHRVLDLGTGDGRLLGLVKPAYPECTGVALGFSPPMLEKARQRFADDRTVRVVEHDLGKPLPDLGLFDTIVSCFAIHHLEHERKRELYEEVFGLLEPGGVFLNLEHVSSPTPRLHERLTVERGGPVEPAPRRGDAALLVTGDRVCGRGLLLEVARDGAPRRGEARSIAVAFWRPLKAKRPVPPE